MQNIYPLPYKYDLFNNLRSSKVFLKIALMLKYHLLKINQEDVPKATFSHTACALQVSCGIFWVDKLHSSFSFKTFLYKFVVVFIDDI